MGTELVARISRGQVYQVPRFTEIPNGIGVKKVIILLLLFHFVLLPGIVQSLFCDVVIGGCHLAEKKRA